MSRLVLIVILVLAAATPALAKQKDKAKDPDQDAPLRFGMQLDDASKVIGDAAMWRIAFRVDTQSTCEFAAVWSGQVFYHLRFLDGKCVYIEKRAEVGPEEIDRLLQMYRGVYGDSPEATSSHNGQLIFSRWKEVDREITISAVGHEGKYKLFYEEFDPVAIGDARVAQDKELGDGADTDPLTGKLRINPMGQAADTDQPPADDTAAQASDDSQAQPSADQDANKDGGGNAPKDKPVKPKKSKRRSEPKPDPVTGD